MAKRDIFPDHPGLVLKEEFLVPMNIKSGSLARALHVSRDRIAELIKGTRDLTPDTALRLAAFFNMSPSFWMNLQYQYDLVMAQQKIDVAVLRDIKSHRKEFISISTTPLEDNKPNRISLPL